MTHLLYEEICVLKYNVSKMAYILNDPSIFNIEVEPKHKPLSPYLSISLILTVFDVYRLSVQDAIYTKDFMAIRWAAPKRLLDHTDVEYAAKIGNLEILKYLHEQGYPWNRLTCTVAAGYGHLNCLTYLHENNCPWDYRTCHWAALKGHLDCLIYAIENGCPFKRTICNLTKDPEIIQYLQDNKIC